MPTRILVFGYYNHKNIGDEQYIRSLGRTLNTYNVTFEASEDIENIPVEDTDVILIGGGDVLNDYFMDRVIKKFKGKPNKIMAISAGLPDPEYAVDTDKLSVIDYIFLRTRQDLDLLKKHFHPTRVVYMPDASIALNHTPRNNLPTSYKRVAVCLSRHIFYQPTYDLVMSKLSEFIDHMIMKGYDIVLVPFNTMESNPWENDLVIQRDLMALMNNDHRITCEESTLTETEILNIFESCDFVIPMRFHACLFSIYAQKPFFPIFTTRKIKNLLLDIGWTYGYSIETDTQGRSKDIDIDFLVSKFDLFIRASDTLVSDLWGINSGFKAAYLRSLTQLYRCINRPYKKDVRTQNTEKQINKLKDIVDEILHTESKDTVVKVITFFLTKQVSNSPYYYGIYTKLFDPNVEYNYKAEWLWIAKDFRKKPALPNNPDGLFDLTVSDQNDYSGSHRSGWQYVYENIKHLNNDQNQLILDLYIDRTFHWESNIHKLTGTIPYIRPWVGFLHHTFDTEFSEYNCETLLKSPEFIESLKSCRAIFVLSLDLRTHLQQALPEINIIHILHPTEIVSNKFSYLKYIKNNDKKLLNVGGWLRNIHTFYELKVSPSSPRKVALKGRGMDNYFPEPEFQSELYKFLLSRNKNDTPVKNISQNISRNICTGINPNGIQNNWYRHFYGYVRQSLASVSILEYIDNNEYDEILSKNIVYLNLVDASAVNTVLECIVRNTPIAINKHPAIVELLGELYPLYTDNVGNDHSKLLSPFNIYLAYVSLSCIDNSKFSIQSFLKKFTDELKLLQ